MVIGETIRTGIREARTRQFGERNAAADYAQLYADPGPAGRYFRSRRHVITDALASCPGGDLLDVGCGPGMMVRELLDSRPGDFCITAMDYSAAMVDECAHKTHGVRNVRTLLGNAEKMPFPDNSFDTVLAMGVLEYTELPAALQEIRRVLRPDGQLIATMLNPVSPYRLVEWHIYWPLLRLLGRIERRLHVPAERQHDAADTGLHAYREPDFRQALASAGLNPIDVAYYDVTVLLPPIDSFVRRLASKYWTERPDHTVSRSWRRRLGTAYMTIASTSPAITTQHR
jgi:ubiquinone/menaquinone biosynthesis C-methylase UbiE